MNTNLTETFTKIANAIRTKKGTTNPINAQNFADEILSIETSSGEDMLQTLINQKSSLYYFFTEYNGDNIDFISKLDTSNITNMSYSFEKCKKITSIPNLNTSKVKYMENMFRDCKALTEIPQLDTSQVTTMRMMFYYCESLITIPQLDTSKVTNMQSMFSNCYKLMTIPLLDLKTVTSGYDSMFNYCKNLTNLTLKNIKAKLQIGSGTSWGHLLTLESLLNTCQECINTGSSLTLTVGSANLEKLASVYVKLTNAPEKDATLPKLPMVQCESSDDGAMSVTDYMALKNWTLA